MYLQSLKLLRPMDKEMHYQENTLHVFDLESKVEGSRSHKMLPSTLDYVTYAPAKFDVATAIG